MNPPHSTQVILSSVAVALALGDASPVAAAEYRQDYAALVGGGGSVESGPITHTGALVGFGSELAAAGNYSIRPGFIGQLNDPPRTGPDLLSRPAGLDTKLTVAALLANDTDPEGGPLTLVSVASASGRGAAVGLDAGWVLYQTPSPAPADDLFEYLVADAEGDLAVGHVNVRTIPADDAPARNLLRLAPNGSGGLALVFLGVPGTRYRIEWTANPTGPDWQLLERRETTENGLLIVTDPAVEAVRFYRTVAETGE